ncbi:outer membrane assembly protein AsmA, partial [Klebsiella pneumoniae]
PQGAPIEPGASEPAIAASNGWTFNISKLRIADSLLIWQQPGGDEYNFRDLNLNLNQDDNRQASVELATRVSRNQRNLS